MSTTQRNVHLGIAGALSLSSLPNMPDQVELARVPEPTKPDPFNVPDAPTGNRKERRAWRGHGYRSGWGSRFSGGAHLSRKQRKALAKMWAKREAEAKR